MQEIALIQVNGDVASELADRPVRMPASGLTWVNAAKP